MIDGGQNPSGRENSDTLSFEDWDPVDRTGVKVDLADAEVSRIDDNNPPQRIIKNIENIIGSDYEDMLTGDDRDNVIEGGDDDDILNGGASSANEGKRRYRFLPEFGRGRHSEPGPPISTSRAATRTTTPSVISKTSSVPGMQTR